MGSLQSNSQFVITTYTDTPAYSKMTSSLAFGLLLAIAAVASAQDGSGCTVFYNFPISCDTVRSRVEATVNEGTAMRTGEDMGEYFVIDSDETEIHLARVSTQDRHGSDAMQVFDISFEMRQTEDSRMCVCMGTARTDGLERQVSDSEVYCTLQDLVVDADLAGDYQDYQATTGDYCPGVSRTPGGAGCSSGTAPAEYGPREFTLAELIEQGIGQK